MNNRIRIIVFIFLLIEMKIGYANDSCHGEFVNPLTDVCWSCLFPITLGSVSVVHSATPDTENPSSPICACPGDPLPRIGISIGFWEPMALVDVTRTPYCLVNLGGLQLPLGNAYNKGYVETANPDYNSSFYYVHWYRFPLLYWLNLLIDGLCLEKGDFDIGYLTELDPTWKDDELAFLLNPEAFLFGNPLTQAACAADSLAALTGLPIDSLFWCAGSQGSLYPLSGQVQEHAGGVQASTLLAERMAYKLHREGLLWESSGQNGTALCYQYPTPLMPKSRYRYQMVNPLPTTGSGGCFPFGRSTAVWGSNHEYPYKGEDFGYLIWRKRNCCGG